MTLEKKLKAKFEAVFNPIHLELVNESKNHAVPKGSETHFKLLLVSAAFAGKTLVDRHRLVYSLVDQEFKDGLHALSLQTFTPEEWLINPSNLKSPPCSGGGSKV